MTSGEMSELLQSDPSCAALPCVFIRYAVTQNDKFRCHRFLVQLQPYHSNPSVLDLTRNSPLLPIMFNPPMMPVSALLAARCQLLFME